MNNYLLFYGDNYYPNGGMEDFIGSYETKELALEALKKQVLKPYSNYYEASEDEFYKSEMEELKWAHIYDLSINKIIWFHDQI